MFNFSTRKVGGLRFVKIGRLTFSFSVAPEYRPFREPKPRKRKGGAWQRSQRFGALDIALDARQADLRAYWDNMTTAQRTAGDW